MEIIHKAKRLISDFEPIMSDNNHFYVVLRFRFDEINKIINSVLFTYLKKYQIIPKVKYIEYKGKVKFITYLYGYCYIKDHLSQISRFSSTI